MIKFVFLILFAFSSGCTDWRAELRAAHGAAVSTAAETNQFESIPDAEVEW